MMGSEKGRCHTHFLCCYTLPQAFAAGKEHFKTRQNFDLIQQRCDFSLLLFSLDGYHRPEKYQVHHWLVLNQNMEKYPQALCNTLSPQILKNSKIYIFDKDNNWFLSFTLPVPPRVLQDLHHPYKVRLSHAFPSIQVAIIKNKNKI